MREGLFRSGERKKRCFVGDTKKEGGVFDKYDRKSDPNGPPRQDLIRYAQLAIAAYNRSIQQKSQCYTVVDIIRSEKHCCDGYMLYMDFAAKLRDQDDDDALTFRASLWVCGFHSEVCFIRPISEEEAASKPLRDTPTKRKK